MSTKDTYNVAVVGALGMVGTEMIRTLEKRNFPIAQFQPLDTGANEGQTVLFKGIEYTVLEAKSENFQNIDIALFSAGAQASGILAPEAVKQGAIVIDNSSMWRMDSDCPLIVPEVNPHAIEQHKGIIANPNCSTIQMVVALKPLHDFGIIERIVVSTYQAVSGSGKKASDGLAKEASQYLKTGNLINPPLAYQTHQIAFNCIPHIDIFQEGGYTKEEYKMVNETKKILDTNIKVNATCVRVPVWYGHSESVNVELKRHISREKALEILGSAKSIKLLDDPENCIYPTPIMSNDEDLTMVGRVREDKTVPNGLNLWIVSNNIRKGAALNAVQIAELLIERQAL